MISSWYLRNFKAFRDPVSLDFTGLNLITGPNSGGKSSIIQSVLLVLQTLEARPDRGALALNGPRVRLGTFGDVRSDNGPGNEMDFKIKFDTSRLTRRGSRRGLEMATTGRFLPFSRLTLERIQGLSVEFSVNAHSDAELGKLQPGLLRSRLAVDVRDRRNSKADYSVEVHRTATVEGKVSRLKLNADRYAEDGSYPDKILQSLAYDVISFDPQEIVRPREAEESPGMPNRSEHARQHKAVGCEVAGFLPTAVALQINVAVALADYVLERLQQRPQFASRRLLRETLEFGAYSELLVPNAFLLMLESLLPHEVFVEFLGVRRIDRLHRSTVGLRFTLSDLDTRLARPGFSKRDRGSLARRIQPHLGDLHRLICEQAEVQNAFAFAQPRWLATALEFLSAVLPSSVHYLGPLRDAPRAQYPLEEFSRPGSVGSRGEQTAATLDMFGNHIVEYNPPPSSLDEPYAPTPKSVPLKEAVVAWLRYLGVADDISVQDRGMLGHEIAVAPTAHDKLHDLTQVGVGVSQLLPIVVMGLVSTQDSILVLEQPELHLHPAVQARMADFLIATSLLGKQCIVETHSEHVINRTRLRMALDQEGELRGLASVFFVERGTQTSSCRRVEINDYGVIENWPEGFFDQSEHELERLLLARGRKRRRNPVDSVP